MYVVVVEVFFVLEMLVGDLDGGSKKNQCFINGHHVRLASRDIFGRSLATRRVFKFRGFALRPVKLLIAR